MRDRRQELLGVIEAIEEVSLRLREAMAAWDLASMGALLAERQSLVLHLADFDPRLLREPERCAVGQVADIANRINALLESGNALVVAAQSMLSEISKKRRQNSSIKSALRSYLNGPREPICTRAVDG